MIERVYFSVDTLPRPKPDVRFRDAVRREAETAFGTRRFWNEVWIRLELRFDVHSKSQVKGDVDNYVKNVLDALTGVAYEDDSQVAGVNVYWVDYHREGAEIECEGMYLVDMSRFDPFEYETQEERFTFLVLKGLDPDAQARLEDHYRKAADTYLRMRAAGFSERVSMMVLPVVYERYRKKGQG